MGILLIGSVMAETYSGSSSNSFNIADETAVVSESLTNSAAQSSSNLIWWIAGIVIILVLVYFLDKTVRVKIKALCL